MEFTQYLPRHGERLQHLLSTPDWAEALSDPEAVERLKAAALSPAAPPSQLRGAAEYLMQRNTPRLQSLIRSGVTDEKFLVHALGDWKSALADDAEFPLLFLGLVPTLDCSFDPRCLYCNQQATPQRLGLDDWKRLLTEAAAPTPPYVYLTGGEPLLLGEALWGEEGLVAFATSRGCAVNVNTNAALITPRVALHLVKAGLYKVHISVDTTDPETQAALFQGPEKAEVVWRGLFNLQIARAMLDVNHPQIHVNCVLTRLNLFQFPDLLRFLLEIRQVRSACFDGKITDDPVFSDFAFHLVPVGGSENAFLRPTAEEWRRFYTETWVEADNIWHEYLEQIGVPDEERKPLAEHVPFANPFLRVDHGMPLDAYCARAADGVYWQGALTEHCHVVPSQAYVLPDGSQYWCGAHAIRRPPPLGNVRETTLRDTALRDTPLRDTIRRNLHRLEELPDAHCLNCAGATCVINRIIAKQLAERVAECLRETRGTASD